MKISRELPQFNGETALILVAARQDATIYLATDGRIEVGGTVHVEKPVYSDREGYFETRGNGRFYGSGSVYEPKEDATMRKFLHELILRLARILRENKASRVFFFVPSYIQSTLAKGMPKDFQKKIRLVIRGNFSHSHPFDLLDKIQHRFEDRKVSPVPEAEARKILAREAD